MEKLFFEVDSLDKRCYEKFGLSEDILQEHAALSMSNYICENFSKGVVLIVCGVGNNGADGLALARLLQHRFDVKVYIPFDLKSKMAIIQQNRVEKLQIEQIDSLINCDILVDCLYGSGLNRKLDDKSIEIISLMNSLECFKISCDIPSGLKKDGTIASVCFKADITITMGAKKLALFSDVAKEYVGDIKLANLGISDSIYQLDTDYFLLSSNDLKLPIRDKKSSHKGSFGHLNILSGEKPGASIIAGLSAINFGTGLVTLISKKQLQTIPYILMNDLAISANCTAIAIGMGLGDDFHEDEIFEICKDKKCVIDADMFYKKVLIDILKQNANLVLTPHPKEFSSLLKMVGVGEFSIEYIQNHRFELVREFCLMFKDVVLLLKGSNMIIGQNNRCYINSLGTQSLSKGGSGDVLSGLISALLAQNYSTLDATINGSLALTTASKLVNKQNYAHTPIDIIDNLGYL